MSLRLWLMIIFIFFVANQFTLAGDDYTGALPPVELGAPCSEGSPTYNWITRDRQQWSLAELFAVPPEISDIDNWSDYDQYSESFSEALGSGTTLQEYAVACQSIWTSFVQGNAKLFMKVKRTTSTTHRTVQCVNEVWASSITNTETEIDESENLVAGDPAGYDVLTTSIDDLTGILASAIDVFNRQPGADTRPDHEYFEQ